MLPVVSELGATVITPAIGNAISAAVRYYGTNGTSGLAKVNYIKSGGI